MYNGFLTIDSSSLTPKYQQIVDTILSDVGIGLFKMGEKIPSINETSAEFDISRDTVEKAYKILKKKGVISAVRGKGYYVTPRSITQELKVLVVFNRLGNYKEMIYSAFLKKMKEGYQIDLRIHNSDSQALEKIIHENLGHYDFYILMSHSRSETTALKHALNKIPKERLILLNKDLEGIEGEYGCIFEDFESDIHQVLSANLASLKKYTQIVMLFPQDYDCTEVKNGFINFCKSEGLDLEITHYNTNRPIEANELYVVIDDADLIRMIKKANTSNLVLGKNFGIIAYNDSPFKEILAGGISVLSTDFVKIGETLAEMVKTRKNQKIKTPFRLISRNSH